MLPVVVVDFDRQQRLRMLGRCARAHLVASRRSALRVRGCAQPQGAFSTRAASAAASVPFGEPGAGGGGASAVAWVYTKSDSISTQTIGRYGLAKLVHEEGPEFLQRLPLGYSIEVVQIYTNKDVLRFHKGAFRLRLRCGSNFFFVQNVYSVRFCSPEPMCEPAHESKSTR